MEYVHNTHLYMYLLLKLIQDFTNEITDISLDRIQHSCSKITSFLNLNIVHKKSHISKSYISRLFCIGKIKKKRVSR